VKRGQGVSIGIAAALAIAIGIGAGLWRRGASTPPPAIGGYVLPSPRPLGAFELVDDRVRKVTPRDFVGHWSFLYFGYTYCPDVCPLTLVELADVKKRLAERTPGAAVSVYFVSVDPERDSPERLHEYVTYFDPDFHGLTGDVAEISALANVAGAVFFVPPGQDEKTYLVSHSSSIALLEPSGGLRAVFTAPHDAEQVAADFTRIYARYGGGRR
jgi:protein SCO1/2